MKKTANDFERGWKALLAGFLFVDGIAHLLLALAGISMDFPEVGVHLGRVENLITFVLFMAGGWLLSKK